MSAPPVREDLSRFALLSIAAAIATIALKVVAWQVSGSVGLLSDAAESVVNLAGAVAAFIALRVVARPPDSGHNFGHTKAEYFAAVFEGVLIVVAAGGIIVAAVARLLNPRELESIGLGVLISIVATVVNGVVALVLLRAAKKHRSLTLEADGKHLMADVWTTVGVVAGVIMVGITGWLPLDSIIAIAVAINILLVGGRLVWRSGLGLMDSALPPQDRAIVDEVLTRFRVDGIDFHDIRTRESGQDRFVQLHMLVPGAWTVQRGHDLSEEVEIALRDALDGLHVIVHVEPVEDARAYESWRLR